MKIWKQTINLLPLHWYCTFWQRQVGFPHSWSKFYFAMCFGTSTFNRWVTWLMGSDSYVLLWNVWSEVEKHRSFFLSVSLSLDLSNYEWGYWQAEGKYDDSSRWFYFLPVCYLAMANISIISDANISYL